MNHKPSIRSTVALATLLVLLPALAQAHPGHDDDNFGSGAMHPLLGWDHILAMVAVGLWAVQLGGRALWAVPLAFVGLMGVGAAIGTSGTAFPLAELGITTSVLTLGLFVAAAARLPLAASVAITGVFAVCHGFAHGAEMPGQSSAVSYFAGFAVSTVLLHGCGLLAGSVAKDVAHAAWLRVAGAAICIGGVALVMG